MTYSWEEQAVVNAELNCICNILKQNIEIYAPQIATTENIGSSYITYFGNKLQKSSYHNQPDQGMPFASMYIKRDFVQFSVTFMRSKTKFMEIAPSMFALANRNCDVKLSSRFQIDESELQALLGYAFEQFVQYGWVE